MSYLNQMCCVREKCSRLLALLHIVLFMRSDENNKVLKLTKGRGHKVRSVSHNIGGSGLYLELVTPSLTICCVSHKKKKAYSSDSRGSKQKQVGFQIMSGVRRTRIIHPTYCHGLSEWFPLVQNRFRTGEESKTCWESASFFILITK